MNQPSFHNPSHWHPLLWRDKENRHMPFYTERDVAKVTRRLAALPALVDSAGIRRLKAAFAAASSQSFVLQTGNFETHLDNYDASQAHLGARVKAVAALCKYLELMLRLPVVIVAVVTGNHERSRKSAAKFANDRAVTSSRGETVSTFSRHAWERRRDANRMLWEYEASQAALTSLQGSGVFTTHEAANLHFEAALVRREHDGFYATSCHLLGLEDNSLFPDSCYLEFCRGLRNPISLRLRPHLSAARLQAICAMLNPEKEPGKLVLITSLGDEMGQLDEWVGALHALRMPALWICDPLQDNPSLPGTIAMRSAVAELEQTVARHAALGSRFAGVHLNSAAAHALDFQRSLQLCSNLVHVYRDMK